MVYDPDCGTECIGTKGWFYSDIMRRARAWTQVTDIYDFITKYWEWPRPGIDDPNGPGGPEGCELSQNQVEIGDLIQYDWENDGTWDHTVIIVQSEDDNQGNQIHWVASHSPDVDDYPFTDFRYTYTSMVYRFVHIERIDGDDPNGTPTPSPTPPPPPTDTPAPTTPPPSSNYALRFQPESVSDAILMPPAPNLDFGSDMTVEFWIRTTSSYGGSVWYDSQWILDKDVPGFSNPDWGIALNQGKITSSMGSGNSTVNDGVWHHVALVRNATSGQLIIYIDGIQDAIALPGSTSIGNTLALIVGSENGVGGPLAHAFVGDLDDLRIWNIVRTPSEIQANMSVILNGNEAGLAGYWDFNEGSGQTAHDKTSTQAHGQLGNSMETDTGDPEWILASELFNGTPPTPVPTTPAPPTVIPTTPPPPTPEPCNCFWDDCSTASQSMGVKVASLSKELVFWVGNLDRITDQATLLYRVRDELLSSTDEGQRFIDLYYEHSSEIASIMSAHSGLAEQGLDVIDTLTPNLQSLLDGQGSTTVITNEQVQQAQAFLNALLPYASPALQQAIADEQERHPLEQLDGKTMDQAWIHLNGFPSTTLLDDFNRANGAIGNNWSGNTSGYNIASNQLSVDYSGSNSDIYWSNEPFGADQEAYVTFTQIDPNAGEQDLLLKSQRNNTWGDGVLEVLYDPSNQRIQVWTYEWPAGWVQHGADIPVTFVDGDQFGARALADGMVEVYRNGELLATRDITSWSHYADGGYIGLWFIGAEDAVLDDFGGGTVSVGTQSMSMSGTIESQSAGTSLMPEQSNVTLTDTNHFWQGVPIGSNQRAYVTFAKLDKGVGTFSKPQSNGVWGEGIVHAFYDVAGGRIQVWVYDAQKGWVQYGEDIPVRFAEGDTFSVRVLANGVVEIQRNGKLLGKRDVTP